ncbi:hypothetical protein [Corynebacterium epidermidicanis]|uniref:hypothetical protein n=1 Tax=Corynebacterium epidermidicanis TaxID=1050174 RepID=UPI0011875647|nr:hypothetical protein [Corynebacterium epidermidicanis]
MSTTNGYPPSIGIVQVWAFNVEALIVFGFIGGFITITRANVHDEWWSWGAPIANSLGSITLLVGLPRAVPAVFYLLGFAILSAIYISIYLRKFGVGQVVQASGSAAGFCAVALWSLRIPFAEILPLAIALFFCTITGERISTDRIRFPNAKASNQVVAMMLILFGGALIAAIHPDIGVPLFGIYLIVCAIACAIFDTYRRGLSASKMVHFRSIMLLCVYLWTVTVGLIQLAYGYYPTGYGLDASWAAFFFGAVMSFTIGSSAEFLAMVYWRYLSYRKEMWVFPVAIQGSLVLRVIGGDAREVFQLWQAGLIATAIYTLGWLCFGLYWSTQSVSKGFRKDTKPVSAQEYAASEGSNG